MTLALPIGSTIGIIGGGQLGRMLSVAASRLGFRCHIFEPGATPPAGQVADQVTTAAYDDEAALRAFCQSVDIITYEFENIPTAALDLLQDLAPIHPGREALRVSQDRLTEKTFLQDLGLQTAPFADITDATSLETALDEIGTPFCFTVDGDTAETGTVTVRDRDTLAQERIPLDEVGAWLDAKLAE